MPLGCKDIGMRKFELVAKMQFFMTERDREIKVNLQKTLSFKIMKQVNSLFLWIWRNIVKLISLLVHFIKYL